MTRVPWPSGRMATVLRSPLPSPLLAIIMPVTTIGEATGSQRHFEQMANWYQFQFSRPVVGIVTGQTGGASDDQFRRQPRLLDQEGYRVACPKGLRAGRQASLPVRASNARSSASPSWSLAT